MNDISGEAVLEVLFEPERQLELFEGVPTCGATINARFAEFHKKNPHVYRILVRLALDDAASGGRRGIAALFEDLRDSEIPTDHGQEVFKLNNSYASRYVRLMMKNEPRLVGHFETRELKAL